MICVFSCVSALPDAPKPKSGTGGKSDPRVGHAMCSVSRLREGLCRALLKKQLSS